MGKVLCWCLKKHKDKAFFRSTCHGAADLTFILIFSLGIAFIPAVLQADLVSLANGTSVIGTVTQETTYDITVKLPNGSEQVIPRSQVAWISRVSTSEVLTSDGQKIIGVITRETSDGVVMQTQDGSTLSIPRSSITNLNRDAIAAPPETSYESNAYNVENKDANNAANGESEQGLNGGKIFHMVLTFSPAELAVGMYDMGFELRSNKTSSLALRVSYWNYNITPSVNFTSFGVDAGSRHYWKSSAPDNLYTGIYASLLDATLKDTYTTYSYSNGQETTSKSTDTATGCLFGPAADTGFQWIWRETGLTFDVAIEAGYYFGNISANAGSSSVSMPFVGILTKLRLGLGFAW